MTGDLAQAELIAVLVAVTDESPRVMTLAAGHALPSGPFVSAHRSLQAGLRDWVEARTHHPIGFLEQLYTFADSDRAGSAPDGLRRISISYLGLVREQAPVDAGASQWRGWYDYFPWEDHRDGPPPELAPIRGALAAWAGRDRAQAEARRHRLAFAFGLDGLPWDEDLVLQRYELLYEAGLIAEAGAAEPGLRTGRAMTGDHRRILATAIARLRSKVKYRPVTFELLPETFTLLRMQRTVEALAGLRLHKSNFRRQVDQQDLIEETGATETEGRGRPAMLFRYRPAVREARALSGTRLPISRD